jgi:tetratricopeptide (TPR) repeat protein
MMDDADHMVQRGLEAHRGGKLQEAAQCYQAALERRPDHLDAAFLLGKLAADCGQPAAALPLLRQCLAARPDLPPIHCELAKALYGAGAVSEAVDRYHDYVAKRLPRYLEPNQGSRDPRHIVFAGTDPRMRHALMARGLRDLGYRVTLVYRKEPNFPLDQFFSDWSRFDTAEDGWMQAFLHKPLCYHLFMIWGDDFAPGLAQAKPGPVVVDLYDSLAGLYYNAGIEGPLMQLAALKAADGWVCRDLKTVASLKVCRLDWRKPRLWFPEYLTSLPPARPPASGPVTVVSVGDLRLQPDPQGHDHYAIAKLLMGAGVHLHIFPSPVFQGASFEEIAAKHQGFLSIDGERCHLHPYVPFTQLTDQLSQFDLALSVLPEFLFGTGPKDLNPILFPGSGSSRLTDYMAAGLPVIMNRELVMQRFMARHYGLPAIEADILLKPDLGARLAALRDQRPDPGHCGRFLLERQRGRLADFYARVAARGQSR